MKFLDYGSGSDFGAVRLAIAFSACLTSGSAFRACCKRLQSRIAANFAEGQW